MPTAQLGHYWRDGMGQYDLQRMKHALDAKTIMTKVIENTNSHGGKDGYQADYKVGMTRQLKELVAYGDVSKESLWEKPEVRDEAAEPRRALATDEISNRMGDKVYGHQLPDMVKVDSQREDEPLVSAQNTGYTEGRGLYQAGFERQAWLAGPRRQSDRVDKMDQSDVLNEDDHVRASRINENTMRTYDPSQLWIGSGFAPGSKKMTTIPFNL